MRTCRFDDFISNDKRPDMPADVTKGQAYLVNYPLSIVHVDMPINQFAKEDKDYLLFELNHHDVVTLIDFVQHEKWPGYITLLRREYSPNGHAFSGMVFELLINNRIILFPYFPFVNEKGETISLFFNNVLVPITPGCILPE